MSEKDKIAFEQIVAFIRQNGYVAIYGRKGPNHYYTVGDYYYWTMGEPIEVTNILNRARLLGRKYFVPYSYIDRSFTRISECQPDDSPAYYYYRLILVHGEKEFANLIFNKEEEVDRIHQRLKEFHPEIQYGYIPPADGKEKPKFK